MIAAIDSDRLYPVAQSAELAAAIPGSDEVVVIGSPYGHDGFLIEADIVGNLAGGLLSSCHQAATS